MLEGRERKKEEWKEGRGREEGREKVGGGGERKGGEGRERNREEL